MDNEQKIITISLWKAIIIVVSALLGGAGGGIWGAVVTINSDHYALANTIEDVRDLKNSYTNIIISLGDIKTDLGEIKGELRIK